MHLRLPLIAAIVANLVYEASAQTTNATCSPAFSWVGVSQLVSCDLDLTRNVSTLRWKIPEDNLHVP